MFPARPVIPGISSSVSPERLAQVAKGIAHPARAAIVIDLADGSEKTVGDIVATSGLAQSTVSQHLRALRKSDLVVRRRDGPRVWYRLDHSVLHALAVVLRELSS